VVSEAYIYGPLRAIDAAVKRIADARQRVVQERRAIHEDVRFMPRDQAVQAAKFRALTESRDQHVRTMLTERAAGRRARDELREYLANNRVTVEAPLPGVLAAAERLRHAQAAGANLLDLVGAAVEDRDDDLLAAAQYGAREYLAAAFGDAAKAAAATPKFYERVVTARLAGRGMLPHERLYHEGRRQLAEAADLLEHETKFSVLEAHGKADAAAMMTYGMATDPVWRRALGGIVDGQGPVEQAEPVGATEES
jgi:hypothetical protein